MAAVQPQPETRYRSAAMSLEGEGSSPQAQSRSRRGSGNEAAEARSVGAERRRCNLPVAASAATSVPDARRDPRLSRFPLRRRDVPGAGARLRLVTPAGSLELLRSGCVTARDADDLPHWADVWPASIALARWLLRGPPLGAIDAVDLG